MNRSAHMPARATAVGVVAIGLWACLAVLTTEVAGIPPFQTLAMTFGIASVTGLLVLALRGRAALREMRQASGPWSLAFCGIFLYHALYFFALAAAPPAQASLLAYLWPLLIVLFAGLLPGHASLRARHLFGALLGLAGTALVVADRSGGVAAVGAARGYIAALACAFVWSAYSVMNRRYASVPSGMLVGVCGAVAVAGAVCHVAFESTQWPSLRQAVALALLGLGPTGLAFFAWDHATKHGQVALLGALSYLAPLLSTLLLVAAGRATASSSLGFAAAFIIGGALVATGGWSRDAAG